METEEKKILRRLEKVERRITTLEVRSEHMISMIDTIVKALEDAGKEEVSK